MKIASISACAAVMFFAPFVGVVPSSALPGAEVQGTVMALINIGVIGLFPTNILLPDITVFLKNTATNAVSPDFTTDLDGAFTIPSQPQATYRLCWKASGFQPGCGDPFTLRAINVHLNPVSIIPLEGPIFGRVTLKDGFACRFLNPMMAKDTWTTVTAVSQGEPPRTVRANSYGQYVLPQRPAGTTEISAACEGARAAVSIDFGGFQQQVNLTLPNALPDVATVIASQTGKMVRAAAAGSTVQVHATASDGGGHPLHYRWAVDPPEPSFASVDAPDVTWKLPTSGLATIYVLAFDNMGGNQLNRVSLSTTPNQIAFGGIVTANDTPFLANAEVSVNGHVTHSNANGAFSLMLPGDEPRFVVTIRKPGYQMLSRALHSAVTGATFELFRAQDFVVDPTKPIAVREDKDIGASVNIAANSLALGPNGEGAAPAGPLHVQLATYNLRSTADQLPGDYGGIDKATGNGVRLQTLGAADIEILDGAGNFYNLAPGKTAVLRMTIDGDLLGTAPPTIPVWHYDDTRGMWIEDGVATKVGNVYETTVKHFSAVNMDLAFNTAACTIIHVDTGIMDVPFRLQMTPLTGGFNVDANHQNQTVDKNVDIVVREPPNISVQFDVIDSNGNVVIGARQTINTGAPTAIATEWNPPPPPPYTDAQGNPLCSSSLTYDIHTVQSIYPKPPQGFLGYNHPNTTDAQTTAYYASIDPNGTKTNPGDTNDFANWQALNGFNRSGEKHVTYENEYDLGFGRDMHMQTGGQNGSCTNCTAYYVTNYASVEDAVAGMNKKATVAMEFSPPENNAAGGPFTKFYVFNPDGSIANSVALDDFGLKNVPSLCAVCHNGNTNVATLPADGNLTTARFIGFDLQSFRYAATKPRGPQEPDFKAMNSAILARTNVSAALTLLIENWYGTEGDQTLPNPTFNDGAVPSQWSVAPTDTALYNAAVKTSCRSCHTTRDPSDSPSNQDISWGSFSGMAADCCVRLFACSPAGALHHIMPQAERTFARFWLSTNPNAPSAFASSTLPDFQSPNNTCN